MADGNSYSGFICEPRGIVDAEEIFRLSSRLRAASAGKPLNHQIPEAI